MHDVAVQTSNKLVQIKEYRKIKRRNRKIFKACTDLNTDVLPPSSR